MSDTTNINDLPGPNNQQNQQNNNFAQPMNTYPQQQPQQNPQPQPQQQILL